MVDLTKLKDNLNKTDVIVSCSREKVNTKRKFYKLKIINVIAVSLKDLPMGCKDAVLPETLLQNGAFNCFTYEEKTKQLWNENLCLSLALVLHLHGTQWLEEETSKGFDYFINKMAGISAN